MPDWDTHNKAVKLTLGDKKKQNSVLDLILKELSKNKQDETFLKLFNHLQKLKQKPKIDVNHFMDWPFKILGPKHRMLFHDGLTPILIAALYGERAGLEAVIHLLTDNLFSSLNKEQKVLLKAFIDFASEVK